MLKTEPMKTGDFVKVMRPNESIYPAYASLSEGTKYKIGLLNQTAGTADSFFDGDRLIGVGGIRLMGLAEAWMISIPEIRDAQPKLLFSKAKAVMDATIRANNLWRIFASSRISENFLEHLGFEHDGNFLVRTERMPQ